MSSQPAGRCWAMQLCRQKGELKVIASIIRDTHPRHAQKKHAPAVAEGTLGAAPRTKSDFVCAMRRRSSKSYQRPYKSRRPSFASTNKVSKLTKETGNRAAPPGGRGVDSNMSVTEREICLLVRGRWGTGHASHDRRTTADFCRSMPRLVDSYPTDEKCTG